MASTTGFNSSRVIFWIISGDIFSRTFFTSASISSAGAAAVSAGVESFAGDSLAPGWTCASRSVCATRDCVISLTGIAAAGSGVCAPAGGAISGATSGPGEEGALTFQVSASWATFFTSASHGDVETEYQELGLAPGSGSTDGAGSGSPGLTLNSGADSFEEDEATTGSGSALAAGTGSSATGADGTIVFHRLCKSEDCFSLGVGSGEADTGAACRGSASSASSVSFSDLNSASRQSR